MRYLPLVWDALRRNRTRTWLTILSILVAFFLFGLLQGSDAYFTQLSNAQSFNLLITQSNAGRTLPLSHAEKIRALPGVADVSYNSTLMATYQGSREQLVLVATDPRSAFSTFRGMIDISPEQVASAENTRLAAFISADLAQRFGWKIGDRVPLRSTGVNPARWIVSRYDSPFSWTFEIRGIFQIRNRRFFNPNQFIIRYDYFDESRPSMRGSIDQIIVRIDQPSMASTIAKTIDAQFATADNRTRSQPLNEWGQAQLKEIGDISFFVNAVTFAVFFTLLFLIANTMMQSFRERTAEIAVLKTIGFSDTTTFCLQLAESVLVCLIGAVLGLLLIFPVLASLSGDGGWALSMMLNGLGVACVLAIVAAIIPALRARGLQITQALTIRH